MGASASLQELSRILEQCETGGGAVRSVRASDGAELLVGDDLRAVVELAVPLERVIGSADDVSLTPESSDVGDGGSLEVEFSGRVPLVPETELGGDVTVSHEATDVDGNTVVATLEVSVPADADGQQSAAADERASRPDSPGTDGVEADPTPQEDDGDASTPSFPRNEDVPPYEDTAYLQAVYDHCDTFEAMTDIIELDVTAETVRRYMIDAGVHEPTSYQTSGDDGDDAADDDVTDDEPTDAGAEDDEAIDDETLEDSLEGTILSVDDDASVSMLDGNEQSGDDDGFDEMTDENGRIVLADGVGLPEGVTVEQVIDSIQQSRTLFEVQQGMGIERDRARTMLEELNLLDIVVGRLAVEAEREVTREEIIDRIRESVSH
jgi:hypothetical protein